MVRTIRQRIVLAIFLVGCIPLLIGLVLASMSGMRSLRDEIGGNFQAIARGAAERVEMLVRGEVQRLKLLASAPLRVRLPVILANRSYEGLAGPPGRLIGERRAAWEKGVEASERLLSSELSRFLLETKVRGGNNVVGLLITDRYGALVAASSEQDRYDFGDEPWWQALHKEPPDAVFIGDLLANGQGSFRTPGETIDIAVPIMDDHQREMIGALKASYRFDALFSMIREIRIGHTGHAMLFNEAGVPLVCPILPRQVHRIGEQLMRLVVSAEPGWGIAEDDGHGSHNTVVGFAPVHGLGAPGNPWHILVRQQPSESYAPIWGQLRNMSLIGLVMIGLLAAMGRHVAARIARPIQVLKTGVESISLGTYDGPLAVKTGDEFDDLAVAIHRMADNLKSSRSQLEGLNRDLTMRIEEKTAEVSRQMRRLEMSERLATLGKVASGIAHEINNPLGIILNRIECLEAEASQWPLPDDLSRDLAVIRLQGERISRVTRSILSLTRGVATTLKLLDPNCVVRTCLVTAGERARASHVRLESKISPDLPPVMGDRDRLETMLLNLVNNAIDAVQDREGERVVTVATARGRTDDGEWVRISIADNGSGVSEEIKPRIFDPFFTTKREGQGTGLGLFLSYEIALHHRGRIEIGGGRAGAVFTVWLPAIGSLSETGQEAAWGAQTRF